MESEDIHYITMDTNPTLVEQTVNNNHSVTYGNTSNIALLKSAGLERAAALIFCLDNISPVMKVLHQVRQLNKDILILVRTSDDSHLDELKQAGATEVIPETMEASLMLSSHLMLMLGLPETSVMKKIREVRKDRYTFLKGILRDDL